MTSHDLKDLELLRRYLLGDLDAGEADTLEERLIREEELFDLAEAVEGDLLAAACTRGELSPTERGRVLRRLAASPQGRARLALARDLTRIARPSERAEDTVRPFPPPPAVFERPAFRAAAMAAGLAVVIGGLWLGRQTPVPGDGTVARKEAPVVQPRTAPPSGPRARTQPQPADQVAERGEPAAPAAQGPVAAPPPEAAAPEREQIAEERPLLPAVIQLASLSVTRGGSGSSAVYEIAAKATAVEIRLPISDEDQEAFTAFKVTLSHAGREILSTDVQVDMIDNYPFVILSTQASELQDGKYEIELRGVSPEGGSDLIGARQIEIRRHP